MHKYYDFGYPCHIPSICKHNFFRKDKLVIHLVYDKLPKDANRQVFPDVSLSSGSDSRPGPALPARARRLGYQVERVGLLDIVRRAGAGGAEPESGWPGATVTSGTGACQAAMAAPAARAGLFVTVAAGL